VSDEKRNPPAPSPPRVAPPPRPAEAAQPAGAATGATYGLRPREVGAEAAIAAGLAREGALARESALYLFATAAAVQASGRLTFTPPGGSYALTFRRGTVEHVASPDPADDVGRFLVRRGAVSAEALARAEGRRPALGGDLVSALIAERAVNPADVAGLLQEHGAALVTRALAVEAGGWAWEPQAAIPPGAFPLGPPFVMLCAAVRALDAAALSRRLGDREHRAAARAFARVRFEDLRLTAQETRAAGLFDGARSAAEIAAASPAEALTVLRVAVLLGELGLLSFGATRKGAARPPAAPPSAAAPRAPAPAAAPPAKPSPPPAAPEPAKAAAARPPSAQRPAPRPAATPAPAAPPPAPLDRASLEARRAALAEADHFAVLGVKRDAPAAQIKAAYFQLAKAYHPDAVPPDVTPEVRQLCADVFAKVSEAWSVLGDDASRAAYLDELRGGGKAAVDVMNIFQAENVFQAGTALVKARKYDEALRRFDEAMKLNADEAEFGMWKAWCEFLLADDKRKKLAPAASAVEAGLKRNPRCAQGYLFLGQMAKLAGDLSLAERQLRRGLQVAPDHAELQREIKYLKK
jgi:curved DNA-binding protein CbpA